jgi:GNAT superfamily N-acetyltransferase
MRLSDIQEIFDREQRREVLYPNVAREDNGLTVRHINLLPGEQGFVVYSRLNENNVEQAIRAEIERFGSISQNFVWKVYDHDTPPDLKERLQAHGFTPQEVEAVLVIDLQDAPSGLYNPPAHDVRRLTDPDLILAAFEAVEVPVWRDDHMLSLGKQLLQEMQTAPQEMSFFAVYDQNLPISLAWIRYHPGTQFAGLWGGSTLEQYRGKGAYQALLAARAQEARMRGARFLTVDASPMSEPILVRRGFQLVSHAQDFDYKFSRIPNQ